MYRRSVNIAILFAILLLTAQFLAGSAQSAGEPQNTDRQDGRIASRSSEAAAFAYPAGYPDRPSAERLSDNPLRRSPSVDHPSDNPLRRSPSVDSSPVMFIENVGQFAAGARFQVRGGPGTMWLAEDGLWITLLERTAKRDWRLEIGGSVPTPISNLQSPISGVNLKLTFPGANPRPRLEPFDRLDTVVSYFIGNDPAKWHPDVPVWAGVRYVDLYPGVDLEVSSRNGRWIWRAVAVDGAALARVRLRVEGADALALEDDRLRLTTAIGDFTLPLLQAVTTDGTSLDLAAAQLTLAGNEIRAPFTRLRISDFGFRNVPAIRNPEPQDNPDDLLYSTFLGGNGGEGGFAITVDGAGNAYVTGATWSSDFPTTPGAFDPTYNGARGPFVVKLSADGTELAYATFLGGSVDGYGFAIAVDGSGAAYITGETWSPDFPTTPGAFDTSHNGYYDTFVTKLNATGSALIYSTFLGGSGSRGSGIAVNQGGEAYVTGRTTSGFPTTPGSFDATHNGGLLDAFVAKLNATGSALVYATYIGGSDEECWGEGCAIAVDGAGNAYVTGPTSSSDFPTTVGAFDRSHNGGHDAFVAKLNATGSALVYATYIGGSDDDCYFRLDTMCAIAVDGVGNAYVTGATKSSDFPTTAGAFDRSHNGQGDTFVIKVNTGGTGLAYATFLGGSGDDWGRAVAVDGMGNAYVTGITGSSDFPTTVRAFDTSYNGSGDAFVVKMNTGGTDLAYATFLGGSNIDCYYGVCDIAVDGAGGIYVTGQTLSSDFPTTARAFDTSYNGDQDAFVAKLTMEAAGNPVPAITSMSPTSATAGGPAFTLTVNGTNFVNNSVVRWNGSNRTTTFVSSTQLRATITAADIATAGTASVTVFNPAPGGGTSNALTFTITPGQGTPDIEVTPATVQATLPEGQSKTVPLTIRNAGDAALTFSIATQASTAAAQSHHSATSPAQTVGRDVISPYNKVDPALLDALDAAPDGQTTFFVYLDEQADLSPAYAIQDWKARGEFVYQTLLKTAERTQKALLADLEEMRQSAIRNPQSAIRITDYRPFFILNAVAVTGGRSAVEILAARPDVAYLAPEPAFRIPEPIDEKDTPAAPNGVEWNIAQIGADRVWRELGITGAGVVVANIDTGVDHTHPALVRQYRGTATGSHDYNWYDPTGKYPTAPGDNHGHGTHVMGIMVGDDGAGNQIGVAPGAKWIAAKGCAGNGCTGSDLLAAAEWILAPCPIGVQPGNPACDPARRPQVVNNSWGGAGGDPWFEGMVQAWRAAGIFPAFAAGNSGPGDGTVLSPGDYAGSFASGASDNADAICWFSSRGPSRLTPEIKPDVATPGCRIRSALPGGSYGEKSGTSMASPHTAGVVALLRQANPSLTVEQIEALLTRTALDLGSPGPDHTYGYGRVDAYSAASKTDDPVAWLTVNPTGGTVNPGGQQEVTLTLNATGLPNGVYRANLVINSNDPDEPRVIVPVTLTVTPGAPKIARIRVSNLRDVSAAVSWITTLPATGRVYYGTNPANLTSVAHDDRGAGTVDDVHHVTIGGLNPNTTYYFYVVSGESHDDNEGQYYQFTTGAPLSVPGSDSVYGQVFKSDGVTPAADVLVYLRVLNNDAQGSPGQSGLLSGLTDSNGYWIDSKTGGAVNLAAARSEDGQSYFVYSPSGDSVRIEIEGAADCAGLTQVDTGDDSPAPDITLSCLNMIELDITTGWSTFVWPAAPAEDYAASDLLGAIAEANGDAPEISRWVPELGNWSGHLRGLPFNDFEVAPGEPYFMRANRRSLLQLPAGIGIAQRDVITLTTGWNFVALPRTAGVIEAESACEQIPNQGGTVSEVVRWDANVGNWAAHVCGLPFGGFQMTPDEGYFIKSQADSVWRPSRGAEERGSRGAGERGSRGAREQGEHSPLHLRTSAPLLRKHPSPSHPLSIVGEVGIRNVQVTNVTDRSFTVLWETDQPATGQVRFGSNPGALDGVAFDDRGTDAADRTHHVTVAGLSPETPYYFAVESDGTTDDHGGALYQVRTGPTLSIPAVRSVYGRVLQADGETPAAGVLVRLVLQDTDGEGSPGRSAPLSAVTDAQGWWTVNLGAARTPAGDAYFAATDADHLAITAWHLALGDVTQTVQLGNLPTALPLEMILAKERVYLPLIEISSIAEGLPTEAKRGSVRRPSPITGREG